MSVIDIFNTHVENAINEVRSNLNKFKVNYIEKINEFENMLNKNGFQIAGFPETGVYSDKLLDINYLNKIYLEQINGPVLNDVKTLLVCNFGISAKYDLPYISYSDMQLTTTTLSKIGMKNTMAMRQTMNALIKHAGTSIYVGKDPGLLNMTFDLFKVITDLPTYAPHFDKWIDHIKMNATRLEDATKVIKKLDEITKKSK